MSQELTVNTNFWSKPPWADLKGKYRLGLKPIELSEWFDTSIGKELKQHKKQLLQDSYETVIKTTEDSLEAQELLTSHIRSNSEYSDPIASMSLSVPDDLCIIESSGEQRLLAASVCSPSYWNLKEKIGEPLRAIHEPVKTLNEKIGNPIEKFIKNAPVGKPFKRENWFIHGDSTRMHLESESFPKGEVQEWIIRSERETLCRYDEKYSLFAINVRFQKLSYVNDFLEAKETLKQSLLKLDDDEITYFGGQLKLDLILSYLDLKR
jgi:hypothetical protein|tara:strand:- start:3823 stop:4617 length:795 start_codon:yes stop_codon:yes gene_type:complete